MFDEYLPYLLQCINSSFHFYQSDHKMQLQIRTFRYGGCPPIASDLSCRFIEAPKVPLSGDSESQNFSSQAWQHPSTKYSENIQLSKLSTIRMCKKYCTFKSHTLTLWSLLREIEEWGTFKKCISNKSLEIVKMAMMAGMITILKYCSQRCCPSPCRCHIW